jgi:hypothetical protein
MKLESHPEYCSNSVDLMVDFSKIGTVHVKIGMTKIGTVHPKFGEKIEIG